MKFSKLLVVLFLSTTFSVFSMSSNVKLTPQQTVINFISDYEQWNEEATQNLSEDTGFQTKDEYVKLLREYCTQSSGRIDYDVYGQYSLHISDGKKYSALKKKTKRL